MTGAKMKTDQEAQRLGIHIGESDRHGGKPLYEAIVERAREHELAGATVLRGLAGFGAHSRIHTTKVLRLSDDLPLVVEIIDRPERIESFLPVLDEMISEGLVSIERVRVISYRRAPQAARFESAADGRLGDDPPED
jgi:PII-like signaling protein